MLFEQTLVAKLVACQVGWCTPSALTPRVPGYRACHVFKTSLAHMHSDSQASSDCTARPRTQEFTNILV